MTNVLVEKVKSLNDDLKDIVYKCTGVRFTSGTEQLFIALLEADVERNQGEIFALSSQYRDAGTTTRIELLGEEVTYKQQAIDELKKSI